MLISVSFQKEFWLIKKEPLFLEETPHPEKLNQKILEMAVNAAAEISAYSL